MSRTIIVHADRGQEQVHTFIHNFRNYGETVWRTLRDNGLGKADLDEIDRSTDRFTITDVKASKVRRLARWIEEEGERQYLYITTEVLP